MTLDDIRLYPDPVLRRKARPIREITDEVCRRAAEMLELMYEDDGVGLAGPQVAWSGCVVTIDTSGEREGERIFINPKIVDKRGEMEGMEGCLSLPGLHAKVIRAERVAVVTYDLEGHKLEMEVEGLAARAWQHELDHLQGILFIDRISPAERLALRHRLKDFEQAFKNSETVR